MSAWGRLLEQSHSRGHFVQLYGDEPSLARGAGVFFREGLRRGGSVLAVTTPQHRCLFEEELSGLGADVGGLESSRRLVFLDAQATLARVTVDGQPDWARFEETIRAAIRSVAAPNTPQALRAYGEMVGILWNARQHAAALRLENLWNKLLEDVDFSLYCAYKFDVLGGDLRAKSLRSVLHAHTHVVPSDLDGALERALDRSMDELLGPEARDLRDRAHGDVRSDGTIISNAERSILWLRESLPAEADRILRRAREYYLRQPCGAH